MNSYILLRDNKETGPHALADLERIGLKSNDLIWIECQSVGWRHPAEINELKPLVASKASNPIEKAISPVSTISSTEKIESLPVQEHPESQKANNPVQENHSSVFVKLPSGHSSQSFEPVNEHNSQYQEYLPKPQKQDQDYLFQEKVNSSKPEEKVNTASAEPAVETKYTRSLDDIKEMYVRNLQNRKKKSRMRIRIPKSLVRVGVYIALVGVGAVTVYLIMNPGQKMLAIADERPHLPVKLQPRPDTMAPYSNLSTENGMKGLEDEFVFTGEVPRQEDQSRTSSTKKQAGGTTSHVEADTDANTDSEKITSGDEDDHKTSIPKNEEPEIRNVPIASIVDQVQVSTNTYTVAALGGIRNLELTLLNDSRYLIDKVTVEVRYLNPSGVILKTQDVQFTSIHPKGTQTIAVKKSNRGVKVAYKVVRIESKGSAYTAGLQ